MPVLDWERTAEFGRWVMALPATRREALVAAFAGAIAEEPYALEPEGESGARAPIAAVLSPAVYDEASFAALHDDARRVLAATTRLAQWSLTRDGAPAGLAVTADKLYEPFTALEHAALSRSPARLARVATARCDLFLDGSGRPWLLEQNTTIPALQGYSDMIARSWVRGLGGDRRVDGWASNTNELLASLVSHYRALGHQKEQPSIVVVSRRQDPERPELLYLVEQFQGAGHRARHAYGDEIEIEPSGKLGVDGEGFDILYRHIFSRRIEPVSPLYGLMVEPGANVILNPVTGPLEVKAMLALLHQAAAEPALAAEWGLTEEQVDAVRRLVPWSRVLSSQSATLPDGSRVPDLAAWVLEHGGELVLKRSWDYGGKSVYIGEDQGQWRTLVSDALAGGEVWVVQELVRTKKQRLLVVEDVRAPRLVEREVYTDLSVYLSQGAEPCPTGGTCRASLGRIVNVAGGGALVPLVSERKYVELVR